MNILTIRAARLTRLRRLGDRARSISDKHVGAALKDGVKPSPLEI
jgi:hypothetical protein